MLLSTGLPSLGSNWGVVGWSRAKLDKRMDLYMYMSEGVLVYRLIVLYVTGPLGVLDCVQDFRILVVCICWN